MRPHTQLSVNIYTHFLISAFRFSSGIGRVEFPLADGSFSAAGLLFGLYISGEFPVQPSDSGGKWCFSKRGEAGGEQGGAAISLGAANICKCRFIGQSVFPLSTAESPRCWTEPFLCFLPLLPSQSDQEQKVHWASVAKHSAAVCSWSGLSLPGKGRNPGVLAGF